MPVFANVNKMSVKAKKAELRSKKYEEADDALDEDELEMDEEQEDQFADDSDISDEESDDLSVSGSEDEEEGDDEEDDEEGEQEEEEEEEEEGDEEEKDGKDAAAAAAKKERVLEFNEPQNWAERMSLVAAKSLPTDLSPDDDPKREEVFIQHALLSAARGVSMLEKAKIPWQRPADYYAEMYKDDIHMDRIRDSIIKSKAEVEQRAHRRQMKDQKKFGKEVQAEVLRQRAKYKREMMDKVSDLRKKKGRSANIDDIINEEEQTGGRGGRGRGGRGGGRGGKRDRSESAGASTRGNDRGSGGRGGGRGGGGRGGRGGGGRGGGNRPGKNRRNR